MLYAAFGRKKLTAIMLLPMLLNLLPATPVKFAHLNVVNVQPCTFSTPHVSTH